MKMIGGVENTPVTGASGITKGVEPRFLDGNDIPVCGVSCVKYILVGHFRFMRVLLPDAKLVGAFGLASTHCEGCGVRVV